MVLFAIFCHILLFFAIFCLFKVIDVILIASGFICNILSHFAIFCHILLYFEVWIRHIFHFAIFCYILLYFAILWGLNPPHINFTWIQAKFWYRTSPILISDFPGTDRVLGSCDQKLWRYPAFHPITFSKNAKYVRETLLEI